MQDQIHRTAGSHGAGGVLTMKRKLKYEWWTVRPAPSTGYTVTEVEKPQRVIVAWLPESEARAIALAHNMAMIRSAEVCGIGKEARDEYLYVAQNLTRELPRP